MSNRPQWDQHTTSQGVAFIRLTGEIDLTRAEELRQLGEGLITDYVSTVPIDLSGVTFIDATGVGALVSIRNKALAHNCVLILDNPTRRGPAPVPYRRRGRGVHHRKQLTR